MPDFATLDDVLAYGDALARMHPLYAAWERAVDAAPGIRAVVPDLEDRVKSPSIAADLRALGRPVASPSVAIASLDAWQALGALYVMEGSTLGGRVILRALPEPLAASVGHATRFFTGYGARTGSMWTRFTQVLDRWPPESEEADGIVRGALECFASFERALRAPVVA